MYAGHEEGTLFLANVGMYFLGVFENSFYPNIHTHTHTHFATRK